jgi:hypothetical protein
VSIFAQTPWFEAQNVRPGQATLKITFDQAATFFASRITCFGKPQFSSSDGAASARHERLTYNKKSLGTSGSACGGLTSEGDR